MMGLDAGLGRNLSAQCDCVNHTRHCDYCRAEDEIARLRAIVGFAIFNSEITPARLKASTGIDLDDDDVESITEDAAEWIRQYRWAVDNNTDPIHVLPVRHGSRPAGASAGPATNEPHDQKATR